jgi:hypothetical protein
MEINIGSLNSALFVSYSHLQG